MTKLLPIE